MLTPALAGSLKMSNARPGGTHVPNHTPHHARWALGDERHPGAGATCLAPSTHHTGARTTAGRIGRQHHSPYRRGTGEAAGPTSRGGFATGAGATLAAGQIARVTTDGYTLLSVPAGHAVSAAMYRKLSYDAIEDFSFISRTTEYPFVLVVRPDSFKTFEEFLAAGRSEKPLLCGGPNGTLQHLSAELLARTAKINVRMVPYRGSPLATADLLGGRIDFMIDPPAAHVGNIKQGKLRALATTGTQRFFALPDTPTIAESGVSDFVVSSWQGIVGPAGLPQPIIDRVNSAVRTVLSDPTIAKQLRARGNEPSPSTAEDFKAQVASEVQKWTQVVAQAKIEQI